MFLETRRYIGAVIQHITYNEWLPIILGPRVLEIFELKLLPRGYYRGYNDSVNPTIANAFAASAFRFFIVDKSSNKTIKNILLDLVTHWWRGVWTDVTKSSDKFHSMLSCTRRWTTPATCTTLGRWTGFCWVSPVRSCPGETSSSLMSWPITSSRLRGINVNQSQIWLTNQNQLSTMNDLNITVKYLKWLTNHSYLSIYQNWPITV